MIRRKLPTRISKYGVSLEGVSECDTTSPEHQTERGFVVAWQEQDNRPIWWF
nr:MAG TPA: hypothetical protein [Caudoviricetes sp.]